MKHVCNNKIRRNNYLLKIQSFQCGRKDFVYFCINILFSIKTPKRRCTKRQNLYKDRYDNRVTEF